eukprot:3517354-Pyramimonas_sp.AAC.1
MSRKPWKAPGRRHGRPGTPWRWVQIPTGRVRSQPDGSDPNRLKHQARSVRSQPRRKRIKKT